jgi:hypothetical protein
MLAALPEGAAQTANKQKWTDETIIRLLCGLVFDLASGDPIEAIDKYFADAADAEVDSAVVEDEVHGFDDIGLRATNWGSGI